MSKLSESPAEAERPTTTPDRSNRSAALIATAVALPVALLVGAFAFAKLAPDTTTAAPEPTPTTARPQSTAPVEMAAPALAERPAVVCRALLSQLPASIRDLSQRPVSAGPEQNAAYGDPAVTVACGGAEPEVQPTDHLTLVNSVCWHATERADVTELTTLDRETAVTVRVPHFYGEALQWVAPVSRTIVESIRSAGPAPSGCTP
ncbi:DUF3515 family protein [Micromonospora endophytica]|uniref:DUF3515 domain-containing protein n=1 Tax=Micromonospora endophytica TaxID=515350 RepID=A0A2W2D0V8_9ACTN|nr:DUF3515 family protein [Micromonospora endophytica]PZF97408.1 DUF3515 domain-containing protein [Micromonospora endophytica]RIW45028.1 DUF3515 family protein [Micromonospora endophytica]BCJ57988.1 hypothetical protein Jiend_14100 [Micromonospora endophytica]